MNTKFSTHLEYIIREMCNRVGANFDSIDFKKDQWYMKHSWTIEEEEDFNNWLVDYLYNNREARKEMTRFHQSRLSKKIIKKDIVNWFLLSYGWKIREK